MSPEPRPFIGIIVAIAVAALIAHAFAVQAAPPPNPDPALADWFRSLKRTDANGNEVSCCSEADCRGVRARIGAGGYEVLVDHKTFGISEVNWLVKFGDLDPHWVEVPNETILQGKENRLGRPVVCWTPWRNVICFVRDQET